MAASCWPRLRTLVLNADYMPLSFTSVLRGMRLCSERRATAVEMSDHVLASERAQFEVPAVIALNDYRKVSSPISSPKSSPTRGMIFRRDKGTCQYCGSPANTLDHIVPRSKGGVMSWVNVVAACEACNAKKGARLLEDTSLALRCVPRKSSPSTFASDFPFRPDSLSRTTARSPFRHAWSKYLTRSARTHLAHD